MARHVAGEERELIPTTELYHALDPAVRAQMSLTAFGRALTVHGIPKVIAPGRGGALSRRVTDIHTTTTTRIGRQHHDTHRHAQ